MPVECDHGDDYWSCPPCQRTRGLVKYGPKARAQFGGICATCDHDYRGGDFIRPRLDGGLSHAFHA